MSDSEQLFRVPAQKQTSGLGYSQRDYEEALGKVSKLQSW